MSANGTNTPDPRERAVSVLAVNDVVAYLRAQVAPADLKRAIADAGLQDLVSDVGNGRDWFSYREFRRLLEMCSALLGGADKLRLVTEASLKTAVSVEFHQAIQSLGSPEAVYAGTPAMCANTMPILEVSGESGGDNSWVMSVALPPEFEPFPELCALMSGYWAVAPAMFGHDLAEVVEETCQRKGAPACRFRARWHDEDAAVRRQRATELNAHQLESRLTQLQDLVGTLARGDLSVGEVMQRIMVAAMRAIGANQCVIVLDADSTGPSRVLCEGVDQASAAAIAATLGRDDADVGEWHVVDIASAQRRYGRLAIVDANSQQFEDAPRLVQTYTRLAASFLETQSALESSRRDARTANALLTLSTGLAELATPDEIAIRLARAVPGVTGCDRALVYLRDAPDSAPRLAASHGYSEPPEIDPRAPSVDAAATLIMPMSAEGQTIGWVHVDGDTVSVPTGPTTLRERLGALTAQGSTAISNALLLDQVRHQSLHDTLTGLANRALLLDRVEQALARSRRSRTPTAVLFIDLDGFKNVNDTLGHPAGDQLLRTVASRLLLAVRDADTVARIGGDEFVVLIDGSSMDAGAELVAERLLAVLAEAFDLGPLAGGAVALSASIGVAIGEEQSPGELLRDADIALYGAKAAGKNRYVVFEPAMQTAMQDRTMLETDLRDVLEANQLYLVYQPIFNLATKEITGVEALLRWQHPTRGTVQPDLFIPLLEESGLIVPVGAWVLREACEQGVRLQRLGHPLSVSVNVSARQIEAETLVDDIRQALESSGLDAAALIVEITETVLMRDVAAIVPRLNELRALGVRIAIDDFGTGYSSLAYLKQFPVDTLKIDRSFIHAMATSIEPDAIVRMLVQLGKALNLETLAEGIEDADQYSRLQAEECESGQGFLLARPLDVADLERLLDRTAAATSPARSRGRARAATSGRGSQAGIRR